MSSEQLEEHWVGKIQYLQEKQGFIRCKKKILGKRDIIFFVNEVPFSLQNLIRLGVKVKFSLIQNNGHYNCRGGKVSHWARIEQIMDETSDENEPETTSSGSCSSASCLSEGKLNDCSLLPSYATFALSFPERKVIHDLFCTVHLSLYHTDLVPSSCDDFGSCWQI